MTNWYVNEEGQAKGPFQREDILHRLNSGSLQSDALVFREGDRQWKAIREFAEFISVKEAASEVKQPQNDFPFEKRNLCK